MQIKRDPQNSIQDVIENALRGAGMASGWKSPDEQWTAAQRDYMSVAAHYVMQALGLTDAAPEGVWIVHEYEDGPMHSVHLDELDALRTLSHAGRFMPVRFVKFGNLTNKGEQEGVIRSEEAIREALTSKKATPPSSEPPYWGD